MCEHWWFSGRMLACHAGGPGSIPGQCNILNFTCHRQDGQAHEAIEGEVKGSRLQTHRAECTMSWLYQQWLVIKVVSLPIFSASCPAERGLDPQDPFFWIWVHVPLSAPVWPPAIRAAHEQVSHVDEGITFVYIIILTQFCSGHSSFPQEWQAAELLLQRL